MEFDDLIDHLNDLIELARSERFTAMADLLDTTKHRMAAATQNAYRERASVQREGQTIDRGDVGDMPAGLLKPDVD